MFSLYVAFATILFLLYPYISFCLIFGVRFLFLHIICVLIFIVFYGFVPQFFTILKCRGTLAIISTCFAQHIVCVRQKRTPTFHFSCFFGYTFPNCCSFYTTYGLYPQKNVPPHFFFPFFEVRMPKPPFISHNKYIVQFTQNLSKPLFITSFHKNNRPAFRSKRLFFQECFLIQFQVSQISS